MIMITYTARKGVKLLREIKTRLKNITQIKSVSDSDYYNNYY
jgi:hypothetical protein